MPGPLGMLLGGDGLSASNEGPGIAAIPVAAIDASEMNLAVLQCTIES